ncbi:hypothetical protein [Nocardioides speluncae]|uniref:hypothetical protein n=1 Tax=Nocardioides speluncae TaxID=2670337 RepID=UPI0012B177E0|nr:hypothetical protein [Nocardioides speluncae]
MDELRRAMLDAGAPRDEWQADLTGLMAAGKQRVRKRRMIATGIAAAVVTVIGTTAALAGVPGLNKSDPDPVKDRHSGVYVEERISPAEVDRRCNIVLALKGMKTQNWVAGVGRDGRAVPASESSRTVETRVGSLIDLAPEGAQVSVSTDGGAGGSPSDRSAECIIPQINMLDADAWRGGTGLPDLDDNARIAEVCSRVARYDLEGWEVLVSSESRTTRVAILMSDNGYSSVCELWHGGGRVSIDPQPWSDSSGQPVLPDADSGPEDPDRYRGLVPICAMDGVGMADCSLVAVIAGLPDGFRVETMLPDGTYVGAKTVRGAVAYRFSARENHISNWQFPVRVLDSRGAEVWSGRPENQTQPGGGVASSEVFMPGPATHHGGGKRGRTR